MARPGAILRLLAVLLCLLPFGTVRQAGGKFAPARAPFALPGEAPAPAEEEDERETAVAKERLTSPARSRLPACRPTGTLLPLPAAPRLPAPGERPSSPFDADPFRNGLGSPYRC
jgi:hypothetical protein